MMNITEKPEQKSFKKKHGLIRLAFIAGVFVLGLVVMLLWNAILPEVIGVRSISFWQSMGILVLSKILFGGFHGHDRHHEHPNYRKEMREKWMTLSPEEKAEMRKNWWNRCKYPTKEE